MSWLPLRRPCREAGVDLTAVAAVQPDFGIPVPRFIDLGRAVSRLHWVLVARERWRRGIGTRLVARATSWSRERGYESVILDTTAEQESAIAFYRAVGFQEIGRSTYRHWEIVWFEFVL